MHLLPHPVIITTSARYCQKHYRVTVPALRFVKKRTSIKTKKKMQCINSPTNKIEQCLSKAAKRKKIHLLLTYKNYGNYCTILNLRNERL